MRMIITPFLVALTLSLMFVPLCGPDFAWE